MIRLDIATTAFNAPWAIAEQIRLFTEYLDDDHRLIVFDNSTDEDAAGEIKYICRRDDIDYERVPDVNGKREHPSALQHAAAFHTRTTVPYFGFIDHDVFPTRPTSLIPLIESAGFLTVGQRHGPTGHLYGWPGFLFVSRTWLAGREFDFDGIRGEDARDDGDCGSMNWPLFEDSDWSQLYTLPHGYEPIREPDDVGLQSWGIERIGDFVHLSNVSKWKQVPQPGERERLLREMLDRL